MILPLLTTLMLLVMMIWSKRNLLRSSRPLKYYQSYIHILLTILLHNLSHLLEFFLSKRRD
uniref:Uncharacterized protein n=1 Tax=Brassica oleracea TaxID=3712 RepID=A0A3P6CBE3_BRAOL|nr:unnamed protein product [Brassica oleracea]